MQADCCLVANSTSMRGLSRLNGSVPFVYGGDMYQVTPQQTAAPSQVQAQFLAQAMMAVMIISVVSRGLIDIMQSVSEVREKGIQGRRD